MMVLLSDMVEPNQLLHTVELDVFMYIGLHGWLEIQRFQWCEGS
jgi:hypothetical protein